jgi:hypothetical protein
MSMSPETPFCQSESVNIAINQSFRYLNQRDAATFRKKFRQMRDDDQQFMHTFRELLAGIFMARQDYEPQYEPELEGLTPDWLFTARDRPSFIADVVNFHIDRTIETGQQQVLAHRDVWCDWMPDNSWRLQPAIQGKAGKYKEVALQKGLPFVVFVYTLFSAAVQTWEIEACFHGEAGLFDAYPTLTGVCHYDASGPGYRFTYFPNAMSNHRDVTIKGGFLPIPLEATGT